MCDGEIDFICHGLMEPTAVSSRRSAGLLFISRRRSAIGGQPRVGNRSSLLQKMGELQFYLTFARKNWIIKVASWSEVKPTPS